jgi:hypothetical protein
LPIPAARHLVAAAIDALGIFAARHLQAVGRAGNFIACIVRAGTFFTVTDRPPKRSAEPGNISIVVTRH